MPAGMTALALALQLDRTGPKGSIWRDYPFPGEYYTSGNPYAPIFVACQNTAVLVGPVK